GPRRAEAGDLEAAGADRRCRTVTGHHPQRDLRVKELVRTMNETNEQPQTAGAFDIRNFIGVLLAIFGIILVFAGLVGFTPDEARRTGGIDANLWTGIGLIVAAIVFTGWAQVRPLRIAGAPTRGPRGAGGAPTIRRASNPKAPGRPAAPAAEPALSHPSGSCPSELRGMSVLMLPRHLRCRGCIRAVTARIRAVVAAFVPRRPRSCRGR